MRPFFEGACGTTSWRLPAGGGKDHIDVSEMRAVLMGATWEGTHDIFITDSPVVQDALNTDRLRSKEVMGTLRERFLDFE